MKKSIFLFFVLISIITVSCDSGANTVESTHDTTYDRVIESSKIRVGYISYEPGFMKDPNTGEYSGIFHEILQEIGKNLDLEIEYVEEVTWGTMVEAVKSGRVDMIGNPVWATSQRAKHVDFSETVYFSGIGIYVREDEDRFAEGRFEINSPDITIGAVDGEINQVIAKFDFPKAKVNSLPQSTDVSQLLLDIATDKADVTFAEPIFAHNYINNNPGQIKNMAKDDPIRIYPNVFMFGKGQEKFESMINFTLLELQNNGFVEKVISKYEPEPGLIYRVDKPFEK